MAATPWQLSGQYFETCSCDYLCPCISTNLAATPSKDSCTFAMVFHVDRGHHGGTTLDDLNFAVVGYTPGPMGNGNWSVGVIADDRATAEQQQALAAIASGQAGGPMARLSGLVGTFLGVESRPIHIEGSGMNWSASIPGVLDQAAVGVPGGNGADPIYLDNTLHPASSRLALATAQHSHLHVFGLDWDDDSGQNNGHFAPFNWQGS
jgi:hypothetical protein